jgi:hypothetical protein
MKREGRTFREVPKPSPKVFGSTLGFVQVWLEVVAIGISNIAAVVRAGKTSLKH